MNYVIVDVKSRRKEDYVNMSPNKIGEMKKLLTEDPDNQEAKTYLANVEAVNARMMTIEQYHVLARRIIGKWAPAYAKKAMLENEDAIDFVAHLIMIGDWNYDESRSTIKTHRGNCGKRAIQNYLDKKNKQDKRTELNLTDSDDKDNFLTMIIDENVPQPYDRMDKAEKDEEVSKNLSMLLGGLNKTQRACIILHYIEEKPMADIGRELNITREGVRKAINEGVSVMRSILGVNPFKKG